MIVSLRKDIAKIKTRRKHNLRFSMSNLNYNRFIEVEVDIHTPDYWIDYLRICTMLEIDDEDKMILQKCKTPLYMSV